MERESTIVRVQQPALLTHDNDFSVGLLLSLLFHGLVFYFTIFFALPNWNEFGAPVIYSVTLEGGKSIGGISQVGKPDDKSPVAPPKNVAAKEPKPEDSQKDQKATDPKDAEVSLAEKKEVKPVETPKPKEEKKEVKKTEKVEKKEQTKKQPTAAELDKAYQQAMQRYLGESTEAGGKGFGAAKVGGKGMGGGVLRPPEFFQYRDLLKRTIKKGWRWYDTNASISAMVVFEIAPDGTLSNVEIAETSGNREYDDSVLRAIYKASPVPAPPENVYEFFQSVRIEFTPGD